MAILDRIATALGRPQLQVAAGGAQPVGLATAAPRPRKISGAGTAIYGGTIDDDDYNSDVQNEKWYGEPGTMGLSRKMERDPHVAQAFEARRAPLINAEWAFEPASRDPIDVEIADFCTWVLLERNNWDGFVRDAALAMRDGFSLIEQTDAPLPVPAERFPEHPGRGMGVVVTGMHRIPAWTVRRFEQRRTDPRQLFAIEQWIVGGDGERARFQRVSASRLIRFTLNQEGANFAGFSYFRRAFPSWKIKQTLLLIDAIRHERYGVDIATMNMPEGATEEDFDAAEEILQDIRAHQLAYMALPFEHEFGWKGASAGDSTGLGEAILRCDYDIAHNMGVAWMLLGRKGGGSFALASTHEGQYQIQLESDARWLANVVNLGCDGWALVDRVVGMNYGGDVARPRLVARNMPTRDWSKVLPIVHNLTTSKQITPSPKTEAFIRSVTRLPQLEPELEERAEDSRSTKATDLPPAPMDPQPAPEDEPEPTEDEPTETENEETDDGDE